MNPPGRGAASGAGLPDTTLTPTVVEPKGQNGVVDAGLKNQHHYKRALPKWRYDLRQSLLPIVRWETPYLAALQSMMRTPALDSYFAITANLGTHTFFMVALPILFWCGFREFGKGLIHILASGVFFTGFIKDMCSLPRPLSPPLQRITMSGSAALEYGFPSTHSANAVSVAVYAVLMLHRPSNPFSPSTTLALEGLAYFYALSIVIGRLYCGMHGFVDVIIGSLMGAAISLVEFHHAPRLEAWLYSSAYLAPLIIALLIIVLVRVHPEPADDCPCFDDSVAFAGVMIGLECGTWRFARYSRFAAVYNGPDATFDLAALGWRRAVARLVFGVAVIFAWREVMKPALLRFLPHLYRVIETWGLSLPRRFFVPASEYKDVPLHVRDDTVLPNVSDLPRLVRSFRGPGRGRSVSIGPQSAADAYETLAYRERRRRESLGSDAGGAGAGAAAAAAAAAAGALKGRASVNGLRDKAAAAAAPVVDGECAKVSGVQSGGRRLAEFEKMMGTGSVVASPTPGAPAADAVAGADLYLGQEDELGEREVFSKLVKPRVRYDVEVVTKLVVYAGIAWLAVDGILLAFEAVGLGAEHLTAQ
ncbi:PAP2 superfamily-domain-containing protein [Parachaetomium inaequale]|uniref:PAP2 superfamily-domain-containing protein n=1 Tax=Parachaetomium inaequale TaxID=2588326 RepID=A0AAN6PAH5_9PEZI|nr:PAP2 superfamily-domain-containing protein [Parachaetomium inaequale]